MESVIRINMFHLLESKWEEWPAKRSGSGISHLRTTSSPIVSSKILTEAEVEAKNCNKTKHFADFEDARKLKVHQELLVARRALDKAPESAVSNEREKSALSRSSSFRRRKVTANERANRP